MDDPFTPQSQTNMTYVLNGVTQIVGPAGQWRADFKIEDHAGNQSNTFTLYVTVTE